MTIFQTDKQRTVCDIRQLPLTLWRLDSVSRTFPIKTVNNFIILEEHKLYIFYQMGMVCMSFQGITTIPAVGFHSAVIENKH